MVNNQKNQFDWNQKFLNDLLKNKRITWSKRQRSSWSRMDNSHKTTKYKFQHNKQALQNIMNTILRPCPKVLFRQICLLTLRARSKRQSSLRSPKTLSSLSSLLQRPTRLLQSRHVQLHRPIFPLHSRRSSYLRLIKRLNQSMTLKKTNSLIHKMISK